MAEPREVTHGLSTNQENATEDGYAQQIEDMCRTIISQRHRPLLVLYYPEPYGDMVEQDVHDCYQAFRNANVTIEQPLDECDTLVHTRGGDPVAAYKLAQVIRDLAHNVIFLVPERAYSAGTLLCFSGNQIRLGHYAGLSPIDITRGDIELTSIDYFVDFATHCQEVTEHPSVASDLLCRLAEQVGALKLGELYRARTLTGHYAQELLDRYMLARLSDAKVRRNRIIRKLLLKAPSHLFHLDFHLSRDLGLIIEEMSTTESDLAKQLVHLLDDLTYRGIICPYVDEQVQAPFIILYT